MTDAPNLMPRPRQRLGAGTFALVTVGFFFFVLYGSLVPFHYRPLGWEETWARWQEVQARPLGMDSRIDFVSNVLLFIPLAFLLTGTLAIDRARTIAVLAAVPVVLSCAALSASIEFTQLWFPPRVSSLNDVLAQTIGGVIGTAVWVSAGQRITKYARSVWVAWGPENLAVKLLPGYLFLLVLIHVMPLDLTISPAELYHKWKEGRVILLPFTTDYGGLSRGVMKTGWNMAYFLPLGLLLSLWPRRAFRSTPKVLAVGLLAAAGIEFLQLFVWTRYCDVTDILTGATAVWLGWLILEVWKPRRATRSTFAPLHRGGWVRLCLFLGWFLVLVVVNWFPFETLTAQEAALPPRTPADAAERATAWVLGDSGRLVRSPAGDTLSVRTIGPLVVLTDLNEVRQRLLTTSPVPLVDLYAGSDYHAFDEVLRKTVLFLPLGALLVPVSSAKGRRGLWRALLVGFLLACLFEAGQLFVPDRTCSVSDVLIETSGAVLGFVLFRRLRTLLEGQSAVEPLSPAKAGVLARIPAGLGVFITEDCAKG